MKPLNILLAAASSAVLSFAPMVGAHAQTADTPAVDANAVVEHGNWTLKEREEWLNHRLDQAHSDGAIDQAEADRVRHDINMIHDDENHMRDHHDGQLTDNETASLETRLDGVADQIHWLHEDAFRRPW